MPFDRRHGSDRSRCSKIGGRDNWQQPTNSMECHPDVAVVGWNHSRGIGDTSATPVRRRPFRYWEDIAVTSAREALSRQWYYS